MLNKRIFGMSCLVIAIAVSAFAGCSDNKSRRSANKLLDAANEANLRCKRAIALMADPYFKDTETGNYSPMAKGQILGDVDGPATQPIERIEVAASTDVNPMVLETLEQAQSQLQAAISENADAPQPSMAIAMATLANVNRALGEYQQHKYTQQSVMFESALNKAHELLVDAHSKVETSKIFDILLSTSEDELSKIAQQTNQAKDEMDKAIKDIDAKVAQLGAKIQEMSLGIEKDAAKANNLMMESQAGLDNQSQEKFEMALDLRAKVTADTVAVQQMENQVELLNMQKKARQLELNIINGKLEAIAKVAQDRKAAGEIAGKLRDEVKQNLTSVVAQLQETADQLSKQYQQLQTCHKAAMAAYQEASQKFSEAAGLQPGDSQLAAQQGGVRMDLGNLNLQNCHLQTQMQLFTGMLKDVATATNMKAPEFALENVDELKKAAATCFKDATSDFRQAGTFVAKNDVKWAYQGSEGAAWLALANVSPEERTEALKKAGELVLNAKTGKEASPHLQHVVRLFELTQQSAAQ